MVVYNKSDLAELEIPVIPLKYQEKVVTLDALLNKQQELTSQLMTKKKQIVKQTFKNRFCNG